MSALAKPKLPRGFALLSPERRREIASNGGKKSQANGKAHQFTSAEAKVAGAKGGAIIAGRDGHMAKIGAVGGKRRRIKKLNIRLPA